MKDRRIFNSNKLIYLYLKQTLETTEWDNQEWTFKDNGKIQDEEKQNTKTQHRNPKR